MADPQTSTLPPGYTLDADPQAATLPPGYKLDTDVTAGTGGPGTVDVTGGATPYWMTTQEGIPVYREPPTVPAGSPALPATPAMVGGTPEPYNFWKQAGSGLESGVGGLQGLAGKTFNILDSVAEQISKLTGQSKSGLFGDLADFWKEQERISQGEAAKLAGGRGDFGSQLTRAVFGAVPMIPAIASGAAAAEMAPGFATGLVGGTGSALGMMGAIENSDRGWAAILKAAAEGTLMGKFMDVLGPYNRKIRLTGIGLMSYAQSRLDGVDHETSLANALAQMGYSALPGEQTQKTELGERPKPDLGFRDLFTPQMQELPGRIGQALVPKLITPQLNPIEQASQQYLTERGIPTPLSMQTGSPTAQHLEASIARSPGGGGFSRTLEAAKQELVRVGQEEELPRIHPESVTPEEAGAAVGGKLARDLAQKRENLLQQVSPTPTTPEAAGQAVIERGKEKIQSFNQQANAAYNSAWQAERDPRNFQDVPVLDKEGHPEVDEDGNPVTQTMALPIDMKDVQEALKPIAARYEYTLSDTDARASLGLKTMRQIIAGPRYKPVSAAELDLSMLKDAARSERGLAELRDPSQGMAAFSVGQLQNAIDQTMASAAYPGYDPRSGGPNPALTNLKAGRAATAQKYGIADVFGNLGRQNINELEPVGVFRRMTWGGDAGIQQLRAISQIAPQEMPAVGRAFIEGGGNWSELGPETKKILFHGDQQLIDNLDQYHQDLAQFGPLTKLEPVPLFERLTRPEGRTINQLRAVAEQAPEEMPKVARAFVQGLLEKATREGDLGKVQSTLNKWLDLDDQSKRVMFEDPALVRDLNNFFFSLKRMMANPNPSGSGFMMGLNQLKGRIMTGAGVTAGAVSGGLLGPKEAGVGAGLGILGGAGLEVATNAWLAKKLFDPGFIRLITKGMDMQNRGNVEGSRLVAGQVLKDYPPEEEPPEGPEPPPAAPGGGGGSPAAPEQPAGEGPTAYERLKAIGDAALERIRKRGSFTGEQANALPLPDMKDMVVWAASRIGQGIVKPAAIKREIASQFKGIPKSAVEQIAGQAHDLELKNVKIWRPGMPLDDIHPLTPETIPTAGKKISKEDVIRYLDSQVKRTAGPVELDAPDKVKWQRLLKYSRKELADQLSQPEPKTDFYLVDTPQADADMIQMFPELGTDSEKMTLMHAASAALAQGSNPEAEAMNGGRAYAYHRQYGRLPILQPDDGIPGQKPGKQWSTTSGSDPIKKLQGFIDFFKDRRDPTGLLGLERVLTGKFPVGYLKQFNSNIAGKAGQVVPGALILGPKIGSYFLDISGIPQEGATVDMWDTLGQYRRLGNMFAPNGKPFVAPRQPDRPIFMDLHRRLENEFNLRRTESQSGLWHYEKDLYRRLGVPTLVKGRSDGTQRLLDAWGHQRQNVITLQNAPPPPSRETYRPPQIP